MPPEAVTSDPKLDTPFEPDTWSARVMRVLAVLWIFVLVLALSPITQDPSGPPKYALTAVIAALMALVWFAGSLRGGSKSLADGWIGWALILFLLAHGLTPAFCPQPWHSLYSVVPWISFALLAFLLPAACTRMAHIRMLLGAVVVAVACSSVYAAFQHAGVDPFPWSIRDRFEYTGLPATYGHPNFAGHALVIALCCGIALLGAGRRQLVWVLPAIALMGWHLWRTGMRAGLLALAAAVAALMVTALVRRFSRDSADAPLAGTGIFVAVAGTGVLALAGWLETGPRNTLPIDSAWILRLNSFYSAAEMFFSNPLVGWGPGRYVAEAPPFWTDFDQRWFNLYNMRNDHVHNELLESAAEAGVAGAASLLALWLVALFRSAQLAVSADAGTRRLGQAFLAAFVALIVDAQFGFNLRTPVSGGLFFLLLGLLHAVHAKREPAGKLLRFATSFNHTALAGAAAAALVAGLHMDLLHQRARGAWEWVQMQPPGQGEGAIVRAMADLEAAAWYPFAGARLWKDLARTRQRLDEPAGAAEAYRTALAIEPHDPALLSDHALFLAQTAEDDAGLVAARAPAETALAICRDHAAAYGALAVAASRGAHFARERGEDDSALVAEAYQLRRLEAQHARETHAASWLLLAESAVKAGDYDFAEAIAARGVRAVPEHVPTWQLFRRLHADTGRSGRWREEASRAFTAACAEATPPRLGADRALDLIAIERSLGTGLERAYLELALARYPNRMALWGEVARQAPPGQAREALAAERAALGTLDANLEQALAPLEDILGALDAADWPALRAALDTVSSFAHAMDTAGGIALQDEWQWLGALCESELEKRTLSLDDTAVVLLPIVDLYAAIGAYEDTLRLTTLIAPYLAGMDLGRALHARSLALAAQGDEPGALLAARQAGALAPFALPIRWNLAVRLWKAGNLAEADFEFSAQAAKLDATVPGYRSMVREYEAFLRERETKP